MDGRWDNPRNVKEPFNNSGTFYSLAASATCDVPAIIALAILFIIAERRYIELVNGNEWRR